MVVDYECCCMFGAVDIVVVTAGWLGFAALLIVLWLCGGVCALVCLLMALFVYLLWLLGLIIYAGCLVLWLVV